MENAARNAVYTSHVAVVEFVEAMGTWVEESLLKRLQEAPYFSIMADECTDISCIEELSLYCRWEEGGVPEEHFLDIIHLKKADAESIYLAIVESLKQKKLQVGQIVGMGFDGASTFSGSSKSYQEISTSCSVCALSLPFVAVGLCSSCQCHFWDQTRLYNTHCSMGILSLLA